MRPARCIWLLLFPPALALAQTAGEYTTSVPTELVRQLGTDAPIYRDLPPGFPYFAMPRGMAFIGAQDGAQQLVLLRTTLPGATAQFAIADALLVEGGWRFLTPTTSIPMNGFAVVPGALPVTLCNDVYGTVEIRGEDGSENRVYLRRVPAAAPGRCEELERQRRDRVSLPPALTRLQRYFPRPRLASVPTVVGIRGMSSSGAYGGGGATASSNYGLPIAGLGIPAALAELGESLRAAGWRSDASWRGSEVGGATWTLAPEPGVRYVLNLTLLRSSANTAEVRLSMTELP